VHWRGGVLLVVRRDHDDVLEGIVARVQTQQQRCAGQLPRLGQHALEERRRALLTVLASFTPFHFQTVILLCQIAAAIHLRWLI
jgi:hypothetical protein